MMAESKQKSTTKARPAAKAPSKAPIKAPKTSSGSIKTPSAAKTSSGSIKTPSAAKTSSGSIKAPSASKTSSGSIKAVAKKSAPKARAKAGEASTHAASSSSAATSARKPRSKPRAPVIEVEPVLVPDAVIVPQQLSMAPLVEATIVEETVLELPKEPPVDAPIEIPIEATRTHHETTHGHHETTRTIHAQDPTEKPREIVVDGWAAQKLDAAQRTLIEAIRAVVRRVAPRALESATWTKASAGAQRSFEFLRDAQVGDAREILEEASERVRHLRTRIGEQLPLDVIERFLRDSVKKNDARGSKRAR